MSNRFRSSIVAAIAFALTSTAQAAGVQFIEVPAEGTRQALTGAVARDNQRETPTAGVSSRLTRYRAVWYPCMEPPQEVRLRGLRAPGVKDCPITGSALPLVVISHGRNGGYGGHHDTAEALADGGFVVAAINHPDENAINASIVDEHSVAANRPDDSKRLIDFMLGAWSGASHIDRNRIGHFGFSRGGYTTLAVIGGTPDYRRKAGQCNPEWNKGQCELFRKYETIPARRATLDARIKAAVIADPAWTIFFGEQDLSAIASPCSFGAQNLVVPEYRSKASRTSDAGCLPALTIDWCQRQATSHFWRLARRGNLETAPTFVLMRQILIALRSTRISTLPYLRSSGIIWSTRRIRSRHMSDCGTSLERHAYTIADIDPRPPKLIGHARGHVRNRVNFCRARGTPSWMGQVGSAVLTPAQSNRLSTSGFGDHLPSTLSGSRLRGL
jgi:Platelet-activating factor acetylhydrolase, isoform II